MAGSDKNPLAENAAPGGSSNEGEEIDRIMKEIEDLEKRMDTEPAAEDVEEQQLPAPDLARETAIAAASRYEDQDQEKEEDEPEQPVASTPPPSKVLPMRPSFSESLAETDAVPARDEPLVRGSQGAAADGGLSLKIGGCADVRLEFSRAGFSVTLSCDNEALSITTDQGAEFRIPFKRSA